MKSINIIQILLISWAGMRGPGSHVALWLFAILSVVLLAQDGENLLIVTRRANNLLAKPLPQVTSVALFSFSYVFGMICYGFYDFHLDARTIFDLLLLPPVLFSIGFMLAKRQPSLFFNALLAFSLAGVLYASATVISNILSSPASFQVFPKEIINIWSGANVNVRSIEQSAFMGLAISPWLLFGTRLIKPFGLHSLPLITWIRVFFVLPFFTTWFLNGRLGWLSLMLSLMVLVLKSSVSMSPALSAARLAFLGLVGAMGVFLLGYIRHASSSASDNIWNQGICDERFDLFLGFLRRIPNYLWGGRQMVVGFQSCEGEPLLLSSGIEATHASVHNVFFDIIFSVGVIPCLFLLLASYLSLKRFLCSSFEMPAGKWDRLFALQIVWLCVFLPQFLFQPLHYTDAILFVISFLWLGSVCAVDNARTGDSCS